MCGCWLYRRLTGDLSTAVESYLVPELPEVQTLRQSLIDRVLSRVVVTVKVRRSTVVTGCAKPAALLHGLRLAGIDRHGKQLALRGLSVSGAHDSHQRPCVCVHLGMSGSLRYFPGDPGPAQIDRHVHVIWTLDDGGKMIFRDPRRFGGLWTFPSTDALWQDRWRCLGPDALRVSPTQLHCRLKQTGRPIKSALLDQRVTAGLGNIYVDELLFACRWHPLISSDHLHLHDIQIMVRYLRTLLRGAIRTGGSTLRDYSDANGQKGQFQQRHRVYGRAGQPCARCSRLLVSIRVVGRTTVYCPRCQRRTVARSS